MTAQALGPFVHVFFAALACFLVVWLLRLWPINNKRD